MKLYGRSVQVKDGNTDRALRKFKKKIADSNLLQDLREREFYKKPTTRKKRKSSAAQYRWKKHLSLQSLPPKLY
jgi:small subunit ribosomal protein S21